MNINATIVKEFRFESAHFLPKVNKDHKCRSLHGHSYKVKIKVRGPIDAHMGWVMDLHEIKEKFLGLQEILDHKLLNDIEGLENPTSENLAVWIFNRLKNDLPLLYSVTIRCSPTEVVTINKSDWIYS